MALLTALEFSELCIVPRTSLASYESRGKIVAKGSGKSKKFDTENPINSLFIRDKQAKKTTEQEEAEIINRIKKYPATTDKPETSHTDAFNKILADVVEAEKAVGVVRNGIPKYEDSVQLLKYLDTLKRQSEIDLNKIKVQKQKGEVVPADLIEPIFLEHNRHILTEFKNAMDEVLKIFSKMKDLEPNENAELKGILRNRVNKAMKDASESSSQSVKSVIKNYTSARAAGERIE